MKANILTLCVFFFLLYCKEVPNRAETELAKELQSTKTVSITGYIRQLNEKPIADAQIKWAGFTTKSDSGGYFKLLKVRTGRQVLEISRENFAPKFHVMVVRKKSNKAIIYLASEQVHRDLKISGKVKVKSKNLEIDIPANSLVNSQGKTATEADIHFSHIDVRGKGLLSAPGRLVGVTQDGKSVPLETFGMFDITAKKGDEKLQIKKGRHIEVLVKLQVTTNETEIPLWSLDEKKGIWKHEGIGKVIVKNGVRFIKAQLPHLSYYNFDKRFESAAIWLDSVKVEKMSEAGMVSKLLKADFVHGRGRDYRGLASIQNEKDGRICLQVKKGGKLTLQAKAYVGDWVYLGSKVITALNKGSSCSFDDRANALIVTGLPLDKKLTEDEVEEAEETEHQGRRRRGITLVQLHKKFGSLKIITLKTQSVFVGALREKADKYYVYTTEGRKKIAKADVLSIKPVATNF